MELYYFILLALSITANVGIVFMYLKYINNIAMLYKAEDVVEYIQMQETIKAKPVKEKSSHLRSLDGISPKELKALSETK